MKTYLKKNYSRKKKCLVEDVFKEKLFQKKNILMKTYFKEKLFQKKRNILMKTYFKEKLFQKKEISDEDVFKVCHSGNTERISPAFGGKFPPTFFAGSEKSKC